MDTSQTDSVSRDAVYAEMYNEMRRCRDYELTASTWYTAILLAVLVLFVSIKYQADPVSGISQYGKLADALQGDRFVQIAIVLIVTFFLGASIYSIRCMNLRYQELRGYTTAKLEPMWSEFSPITRRFTPFNAVILTQLIIVLITDHIVLLPSKASTMPDVLEILVILFSLVIIRVIYSRLPMMTLKNDKQDLSRTRGAS
jgi:hypothetical protein